MNHWPFIAASYAFAILASGGLAVWSLAAMRRAEADAEALRRDP